LHAKLIFKLSKNKDIMYITHNMKLRYFSDLHSEFINPNKIERFIEEISNGIDEICILA
jgi:hypothetical protein